MKMALLFSVLPWQSIRISSRESDDYSTHLRFFAISNIKWKFLWVWINVQFIYVLQDSVQWRLAVYTLQTAYRLHCYKDIHLTMSILQTSKYYTIHLQSPLQEYILPRHTWALCFKNLHCITLKNPTRLLNTSPKT